MKKAVIFLNKGIIRPLDKWPGNKLGIYLSETKIRVPGLIVWQIKYAERIKCVKDEKKSKKIHNIRRKQTNVYD